MHFTQPPLSLFLLLSVPFKHLCNCPLNPIGPHIVEVEPDSVKPFCMSLFPFVCLFCLPLVGLKLLNRVTAKLIGLLFWRWGAKCHTVLMYDSRGVAMYFYWSRCYFLSLLMKLMTGVTKWAVTIHDSGDSQGWAGFYTGQALTQSAARETVRNKKRKRTSEFFSR